MHNVHLPEMSRVMHIVYMNMQQLRAIRGWSQRDLADLIGVDQSTIQRAEAMHPSAKLATYLKCAEVFGVPLVDIFSDDRTTAEFQILQAFRDLSPDRQQGWLDMARAAIAAHPQEPSETR